jgi:hypothetical protein
MSAKPGRRATASLIFGLYFMVQEPRGYIPMSMAWFFWERRVKWRMTSISLTSGQSSDSRANPSGNGVSGTSGSGKRTPRRPGLLSS